MYFQQKTGANFEIVHYRGAVPATQAVIAGHIDMNFDQAANSIPQYKAGKVKAFAVTAAKRLAAAPDVPRSTTRGCRVSTSGCGTASGVPHGTPAATVSKLNAAMVEADPTVRKRLEELGQDIMPPDQQSASALGAHHKGQIDKWRWPLIKAAKIKSE